MSKSNFFILGFCLLFGSTALASPPVFQPVTIPTTVSPGSTYKFTPEVVDSDGDTLRFVVRNKPAWLKLSYSTGTLSGTPQASDIGTYENIQLFATDGVTNTPGPKFNIVVTENTPNPPSVECIRLSWTPPTQNTNGKALTDLAGYEVVYGPQNAKESLVWSILVTDPGVRELWIEKSSQEPRYAAVRAVNSQGTRSNNSNIVEVR